MTDITLYKISYDEYSNLLNQFCKKIKEHLNPEYVYGVPRGGLPIAVVISHYFSIPLILNINDILELSTSKKILIVDEIMDSGKTFTKLYNKLFNYNVTFATLTYKPRSTFYSAIKLKKYNNDVWVKFPWEIETVPDKEYMYG